MEAKADIHPEIVRGLMRSVHTSSLIEKLSHWECESARLETETELRVGIGITLN